MGEMKELNTLYRHRKTILFGAGTGLDLFFETINANNTLDIMYIVDNKETLWGRTKNGLMIKPPSDISNENQDDIFVFVTTSFYGEVKNQLVKMGLRENANFTDGIVNKEYRFEGWGMRTLTYPPWEQGGGETISQGFFKIQKNLEELVHCGRFVLSQLEGEPHKLKVLRSAMWRHYIIYSSIIYACNRTKLQSFNFAECGVCDGWGAYFAVNAAFNTGVDFKYYLYDSWQGMKREYLLDSEDDSHGKYSHLDIERAKTNLAPFNEHLVFNKGFVPDSFEVSNNPDRLSWLHIDLNSALPTIAALDFFFDKLENGGIVLLDDYAWPGYEDTKTHVDKWVQKANGMLFQFPTGQGVIIKN